MMAKDKAELAKIVGENLYKARNLSNLTRREVNDKLFNGNGNRLSEIEHGVNLPTYPQLIEMAQLYGVSLDFVFGLSTEYEMNTGCYYSGLVLNTMREAGLDIADRISESLISLSKNFPPHSSQLLLDSSKRLVREFMKYRQDMVFSVEYMPLDECIKELQFQIQEVEKNIARKARIMEVAYQDALDEVENTLLYSRKQNKEE